jgi:hypothetical protein
LKSNRDKGGSSSQLEITPNALRLDLGGGRREVTNREQGRPTGGR